MHPKSSLTMDSRTNGKLIALGLIVSNAFNSLQNRPTRLLAHGWYAVMCNVLSV